MEILQDNFQKLTAYAYVWENKNDANLYGDWDFEVFPCTSRTMHLHVALNGHIGIDLGNKSMSSGALSLIMHPNKMSDLIWLTIPEILYGRLVEFRSVLVGPKTCLLSFNIFEKTFVLYRITVYMYNMHG